MPFSYGLERLEPAFEDRPVPYIAYGARFHDLVATHLTQTLGAQRAFIISGKTIAAKTEALKRLEKAVSSTDTKLCGTRIGISPHTPWGEVVDTINEVRTAFADSPLTERDIIITLGGGSLTDAAKVIAWAVSNPAVKTVDDLEPYYSGTRGFTPDGVPAPIIRVITVPTTLSGGEYQSIAGVTRPPPSEQKCLFTPPTRNPSLVVLDPDLTTTTPAKYWLSTGVRAIDHCVETICSLQSNEAGDQAAERGLQAMVSSLLRTTKDSHDLDARFDSMRGVIDAMSAVGSGVPLGGSHAIGHQLVCCVAFRFSEIMLILRRVLLVLAMVRLHVSCYLLFVSGRLKQIVIDRKSVVKFSLDCMKFAD